MNKLFPSPQISIDNPMKITVETMANRTTKTARLNSYFLFSLNCCCSFFAFSSCCSSLLLDCIMNQCLANQFINCVKTLYSPVYIFNSFIMDPYSVTLLFLYSLSFSLTNQLLSKKLFLYFTLAMIYFSLSIC